MTYINADHRRPSQTATSFRMRLQSVHADSGVTGPWEHFRSFNELFRASRVVASMKGFELVHTSANSHYRATGHHRMVLRPVDSGDRGPRVVVHIVMK